MCGCGGAGLKVQEVATATHYVDFATPLNRRAQMCHVHCSRTALDRIVNKDAAYVVKTKFSILRSTAGFTPLRSLPDRTFTTAAVVNVMNEQNNVYGNERH